jgi:hypothetical protein
MKKDWVRRGILGLVLAGAALAVACGGGGPEGKYQDKDGTVNLELKDGKADMSVGPVHVQGTYQADNDKIVIRPAEGDTNQTVTFSRNKDGSLDAPPESGMPRLQRAK